MIIKRILSLTAGVARLHALFVHLRRADAHAEDERAGQDDHGADEHVAACAQVHDEHDRADDRDERTADDAQPDRFVLNVMKVERVPLGDQRFIQHARAGKAGNARICGFIVVHGDPSGLILSQSLAFMVSFQYVMLTAL